MPADNATPPGTPEKRPMTSARRLALFIYVFVLVVLVRLYWPGWPLPSTPQPAATPPPTSGPQVPQN